MQIFLRRENLGKPQQANKIMLNKRLKVVFLKNTEEEETLAFYFTFTHTKKGLSDIIKN